MFTVTHHYEVIADPVLINAHAVLYIIEDSKGNKIQAIKKVRLSWSIGLKDAKEIVEHVAAENNMHWGVA